MIDQLKRLKPGNSRWVMLRTPGGNLDVWIAKGTEPGPMILVTAGVHGDEYEGPLALALLSRSLKPKAISGTVVLCPLVNRAAFDANSRTSPEDGLNLARVFPGLRGGQPTEKLADFFFEHLVWPADYLIDLHSGGVAYDFHPMACFYGDPVPGNASFDAARAFGIPLLWQLPDTPGVLSREFHALGKVAVGAEYRGSGCLAPDGMVAYIDGVENLLRFWTRGPDQTGSATPVEVYGGNWHLSPTEGFFLARHDLGETVEEDGDLGVIFDTRGAHMTTIVAERSGKILGLRSMAHIREDDWAVLLGSPL